MNQSEPIQHIAIVGGGTAGWISAAALVHALQPLGCRISVIESPDIPTIGVGEATIPPIVDFLRQLGIDETDFIEHTQATFKLGIKFQDWHRIGSDYWHPFGSIGVKIDGREFLPHWLRAHREQPASAGCFSDCSPAAVMADKHRFYHPHKAHKDSFLAGASYAYHFDAGLVAEYLKRHSLQRGVTRIADTVVAITRDDRGFIQRLILENQPAVVADFYIDCTGFSGLLIDKNLKSRWENWQAYLPCDRAVAVPSSNRGELAPFTLSSAQAHGWTWRIPLQHRTGNGYVYASAFCDEQSARDTLLQSLPGDAHTEPRVISFKTGCRPEIWRHNCLAVGLAAGFVEPLESTAIHLIMKGIKTFLNLLPDKHCNPVLAREYNRILYASYTDIRDFIVLHYCTSQRDDSDFWRWCRHDMQVPDTLKEKIALFRARGALQEGQPSLFKEPSWYSVLLGMGVIPQHHDPLIAALDSQKTLSIITQVRELQQAMADSLPSHQHYLERLLAKTAEPL